MNHGQVKEKINCRNRPLAPAAFGLLAVAGVCGAISTRAKAAGGLAIHDGAKCQPERGFMHRPQSYGRAWVVRSSLPIGGGQGIAGAPLDSTDPSRLTAGLQPIRLHPVSIGLRPVKARREAGLLRANGLRGRRRQLGKCSNGKQSGAVATRQKNANCSPATVQSTSSSYRHGTKCGAGTLKSMDFVPPGYKTPCFSGSHRTATGQLYRLAIYVRSIRHAC